MGLEVRVHLLFSLSRRVGKEGKQLWYVEWCKQELCQGLQLSKTGTLVRLIFDSFPKIRGTLLGGRGGGPILRIMVSWCACGISLAEKIPYRRLEHVLGIWVSGFRYKIMVKLCA